MQRETSVVIFGGTSEGRELAEYAEIHRVPVLISVVSGYGESLLKESDLVQVHTGALDEAAMRQFLKEAAPKLVLDATHPYARVVTEQVFSLCKELQLPYQRILRASGQQNEKQDFVILADSTDEAVQYLKQDDRPVFLTTGSKELEVFSADPQLRERIYARVLPDSQVLTKCESLGLHGAQVIAMQGPFSTELNLAMLRSVKAGWLVTKEAGKRGGFAEKIEAAKQCGAKVIVIRRPVLEEGITMDAAKKLMDAYKLHAALPSDLSEELQGNPKGSDFRNSGETDQKGDFRSARTLSMIGMGMGGGSQLTLEALEALKQSDLVFGASRMLQDLKPWIMNKEQKPYYQPEQILNWMDEHEGCRNAVVICSGDTGFYSGSGSMLRELKRRLKTAPDNPYEVKIYPGISSVSALAAKFQISWEDACLASAHGRDCDVEALLREHKKVFLLLDGSRNLRAISRKLNDAGMGNTKIYAGIRMGYKEEQLICKTADELTNTETDNLTAVFLERDNDER